MLITKTNPIGIDKKIQGFQHQLYSQLDWDNYDCHGRCYRNKTDSGYKAEVFTSDHDYKDVILDDSLSALSFFGTGSKVSDTTNIHLIYFVNLDGLKPSFTHRADEELRLDVIKICREGLYGFRYDSVETGIENCLREYPASIEHLQTADMHPWHCFRINLTTLSSYDPCP